MIKRGIWLVAISMLPFIGFGQSTTESQENKPSLDGGTLKSQYDYLIDESNDYQEYKVIRKTWVAKFEKSLNDSLEAQQEAREEAAQLASQQSNTIKQLQGELATTRDSLALTQSEKRNMNWLGMPMEKTSYRILMWSLIGVLTLIVVILLFMYKNSHAVTRSTKEKYEDLDEEFTEYRKRSLEREQKLRRELQDEINKQKM